MTPLRYLHLDVFTYGPSGGHPLIVCLDQCPASAMPALSHEFGLVVAFPVVTSPGRYHVRIFEHGHELLFGGQPTLGAAWSLGPGRWRQDSRGASVEVEAMADGARMGTPDPVLDPIDDDSLLAGISGVLGVDIDGAYRTSCGGNTHLLVPVRADIGDLTVDHGEVARICEAAGMNTLSPFRWHAWRDHPARVRTDDGHPGKPCRRDGSGPGRSVRQAGLGRGLNIRVHQGHGTGRASLIEVHAERGAMTLAGVVRKFAEGTCEVGWASGALVPSRRQLAMIPARDAGDLHHDDAAFVCLPPEVGQLGLADRAGVLLGQLPPGLLDDLRIGADARAAP